MSQVCYDRCIRQEANQLKSIRLWPEVREGNESPSVEGSKKMKYGKMIVEPKNAQQLQFSAEQVWERQGW